MQNLFVIRGWKTSDKVLRSCITYTIKCDRWSQIAELEVNRANAACTVLEGEIVVTGGCDNGYKELKSVEQYDYH